MRRKLLANVRKPTAQELQVLVEYQIEQNRETDKGLYEWAEMFLASNAWIVVFDYCEFYEEATRSEPIGKIKEGQLICWITTICPMRVLLFLWHNNTLIELSNTEVIRKCNLELNRKYSGY